MKIAIAAATGNIGSNVARQLASRGATPVLLGQSLERLNKLNIKEGIPAVADLSDPEQVINATPGVNALLWIVPPVVSTSSLKDWYQRVTNAGIAAVEKNKIDRVVLISTLGAGAAPQLGTISYGGDMEVAFDKLNTNVLALRPGYYMENFVLQAQNIQENDQLSFPFDPSHDIPFISTNDIADVAAKYLLDKTWSGHWKHKLMGPQNLTLDQVASRLSALSGRSIRYIQQSPEELNAQLSGWGVNDQVQDELVELYGALGDPDGAYATPRTPEAFTPTTLEMFFNEKLSLALKEFIVHQ